MGRIRATLSGIERGLLNRLAEADAAATISHMRLATGQLIRFPRDDPAGFVRLSRLRSQWNLVNATMKNVAAAGSLITQGRIALGNIRTQLDAIRAELLKDEDRSLTSDQRLAAQATIDEAIAQIGRLATARIDGRPLLDGSANFRISGRHPGQVRQLRVYSTGGAAVTVSGSVIEPATRAVLTHQGLSDNRVEQAATLVLTGNLGSVEIAVAAGESLDDVAARINDRSHKTGVTAAVDAEQHTLSLLSVAYGLNARVAVAVSSGTFAVTGGNGDGTAQGTDVVAVINGRTYGQSAPGESTPDQPAVLRHREETGTITADVRLRITGHLGSATVDFSAGQTLAQAAAAIEAQSGATGVSAVVEGNELVLRSTIAGADALVTIEVLSGTFDTTSGYTPGSQATLVHVEPTGVLTDNARFKLIGVEGNRNFNVKAGDTLQEVAEVINGQTSSTGVEAAVEGNELRIRSVGSGSEAFVTFELLNGLFDVTGADAEGTAYGTDAYATARGADGQTQTGGGDGGGSGDSGGNGNRIAVQEHGIHYQIEFAVGFTGELHPIRVDGGALTFALSTDLTRRSTLAIPGVQPSRLGGVSGSVDQLASGGALAGLDGNTSQAIRVVDEALAGLTVLEGAVDGFFNAAIGSASAWLSELSGHLEGAIEQFNRVDEQAEKLRESYFHNLALNAAAGLSLLRHRRSVIVQLIQQIAGLAT